MSVLIEAADLSRLLDGRVLWRDWGCAIRTGESVGVLGPSGSGKSLLLRALAGLDPLETGEVRFEGKAQSVWPMPTYRSRVMYLPQRPTFDEGRVLDAFRIPFRWRVHREQTFNADQAVRLLESLDRGAAFLNQDAGTLSGGEGQITALVRALLLDPSVLLLDEATSALDSETVRRVERLLGSWCQETPGRALVWVSHDPAQRARVFQRELLLVPAADA